MSKRLYIETVGCQMNVLDSELVVAALRKQGYELVDAPAKADTYASPNGDAPAFARFRQTNVQPQRQNGFSTVEVKVRRGDLTPDQLRGLAQIMRDYTGGYACPGGWGPWGYGNVVPARTTTQVSSQAGWGSFAPLVQALGRLYGLEKTALGKAGRTTIDAVSRIETLRTARYSPAHGVVYASDNFGRGLMEVARLIKARVGLQSASVDLGGWDSHFGQSTVMDPLMTRLAKGLAAFYRDLGTEMDRTTVVAMTEFGRRAGTKARRANRNASRRRREGNPRAGPAGSSRGACRSASRARRPS